MCTCPSSLRNALARVYVCIFSINIFDIESDTHRCFPPPPHCTLPLLLSVIPTITSKCRIILFSIKKIRIISTLYSTPRFTPNRPEMPHLALSKVLSSSNEHQTDLSMSLKCQTPLRRPSCPVVANACVAGPPPPHGRPPPRQTTNTVSRRLCTRPFSQGPRPVLKEFHNTCNSEGVDHLLLAVVSPEQSRRAL